ncbi:hypothetical protein AQB9606_00006 [Aquabacterium sp. CECT 9606]|nr:hypothetical protein AQB9606_00006 [Aquabacterium sp. CECT 9606]
MAALYFKLPVTALQGGAGEVIAGGHISTGEGGQALHQGLATGLRTHVATIDQQVGVLGQGLSPRGDVVRARGQGRVVQHRVAQLRRAAVAVRDQVHGRHALPVGQGLRDAGDAIFIGRDRHDLDGAAGLGLRIQVGQEHGLVGHAGIDEDQFGPRRGLPHIAGRGVDQALLTCVRGRDSAAHEGGWREVGGVQQARLHRFGDGPLNG